MRGTASNDSNEKSCSIHTTRTAYKMLLLTRKAHGKYLRMTAYIITFVKTRTAYKAFLRSRTANKALLITRTTYKRLLATTIANNGLL